MVEVRRLSIGEAREVQRAAESAMPLLLDEEWMSQQCECSGCLETALAEEYGWDVVHEFFDGWNFVTWALEEEAT